jgi:uncharacterized protein (TIGR02996 family)
VILFSDETADALYATVLAHPDLDAPRLVLADRLRESGKERYADFIQQQVAGELGVLPLSVYATVCDDLFPGQSRRSHCSHGVADVHIGDVTLTWRRGFLSEVLAPLAWLLGGECERCVRGVLSITVNPPPLSDEPGETEECPACHGTGRTPGYLAGLVRKWPLELVVATDREPMPATSRRPEGFIWWNGDDGDGGGIHPQSDLPGPVFSRLQGERLTDVSFYFPTRAAALAALSDAIIRLAKEER